MKIAKNSQTVVAGTNQPATDNNKSKYEESIGYIRSAISALGAVAKDDNVAKDAIADLSVILFSLQ